jgi:hypothetical protein
MPSLSAESHPRSGLLEGIERDTRLRELMSLHRQQKIQLDGAVAAAPSGAGTSALASAEDPAEFVQDWDMLFDAVCMKLREAVEKRPPDLPRSASEERQAANRVREQVLDGLGALDILHRILREKRANPSL